ncbi:MAG: glycine cleavage system aminomethyltransferase GcvT [Pseudomonadota bacterium]|nr:glycine cleavage system aminomethyltransferase GcvT [Pseudomonadota bacterium]
MIELKRTPLHQIHIEAGARMVGFGGWSMPVAYQSQIEEHNAVRSFAGMFDVSHMTIVDVSGNQAEEYLRWLLANDVAKLKASKKGICKALYTCMLNDNGGILDDLIVYRLNERLFRLIVNAATREKDLAWLSDGASRYSVKLIERVELAMVAVQGPQARTIVDALLSGDMSLEALAPFTAKWINDWLVARTGYTGEDGVEILLPAGQVSALWEGLLEQGVMACGLGARDTLRLEAGLNLYGLDMDESITPLECGLEWTVSFGEGRAFMGRDALEERFRGGIALKQVGLILEGRGVLRAGFSVKTRVGDGTVTSGTFSPTLARSIALARVPTAAVQGPCEALIRGRSIPVQCVKPPFVRNGEIKVELETKPMVEENLR